MGRKRDKGWGLRGLLHGLGPLILLSVLPLAAAREVHIHTDLELAAALREVPVWRAAGEEVELVLAPGEYRTPLRLAGPVLPDSDEPPRQLTIRASEPGRTVFSEAIRLENWEQLSFRVWQHVLPDTARSGRLFYDGAWLRQAADRERMNRWEYLVEPEVGTVLIAIPEGAAVDFSAFRWASGRPGGLLLLQRVENARLSGLTFAYDFPAAGTTLFDGPSLVSCRQIEIVDCRFLWNQRGLRVLDVDTLRILDSRFQHNGEQGLHLSQVSDLELRGLVISHNGRLESVAQPGLPFGHAVVVENLRGNATIAHTRIHDNTAGFLLLHGNGFAVRMQHLVIGHHRGAGLALAGRAPMLVGAELRVGRNGGPAIDLQAPDPVGGRAMQISESIFFSASGDPVIAVGFGTLQLERCIVESRVPGGWLFRLDGNGSLTGRDNLYFHRDGSDRVFNGESFQRWTLDPDRDGGSRFEDPQFLNTETLDFDMDFSSPWFRR